MDHWLYMTDLGPIVGGLLVIFAVSWGTGLSLGRRAAARASGGDPQGQAIEAAILTLFGLILGFTFSMAVNRYEARRLTAIDEANAIGTALLRAEVLDDAKQALLKTALRGYLAARLEAYEAPRDAAVVQAAGAKADHFQRQAWDIVASEARLRQTPVQVATMTAVNAVIDLRERQMAMFENVVPSTVLLALFGLGGIAIGIVGYMNGVAGRGQAMLSLTFAAFMAATLFLILDLDRPRRGLIQMNYESLQRLRLGLEAASPSPK